MDVDTVNEDVIIAAHRFALHTMCCPVCSADGKQCCEEGLALLKDFQAALPSSQSDEMSDDWVN